MHKRKVRRNSSSGLFVFSRDEALNTPANRQSKLHTERVSINKGIEKGEKNGMDKLPRKIL